MARTDRARPEIDPVEIVDALDPKLSPDALFKSAVRARFEQAERAAHAAARDRNPTEAARQTEIANACAGLLRVLP